MLYAAYGSNLHPRRLAERTPSAVLVGTAYLEGWALRFHKRGKDASGKCNIEAGGDGVHLALYELDDSDQQILDGIEGVGYARTTVGVPGYGQCTTYTALDDAVDNGLKPFDWYLELVLLGARQLGFAASYIEELEAVCVVRDPEPDRRLHHYRLIRTIRNGG